MDSLSQNEHYFIKEILCYFKLENFILKEFKKDFLCFEHEKDQSLLIILSKYENRKTKEAEYNLVIEKVIKGTDEDDLLRRRYSCFKELNSFLSGFKLTKTEKTKSTFNLINDFNGDKSLSLNIRKIFLKENGLTKLSFLLTYKIKKHFGLTIDKSDLEYLLFNYRDNLEKINGNSKLFKKNPSINIPDLKDFKDLVSLLSFDENNKLKKESKDLLEFNFKI